MALTGLHPTETMVSRPLRVRIFQEWNKLTEGKPEADWPTHLIVGHDVMVMIGLEGYRYGPLSVNDIPILVTKHVQPMDWFFVRQMRLEEASRPATIQE